jgi:hypothetical protein
VLKQQPVVNLLHTPRLAADKQAVHELVENVPHDVKMEQAWIGEGPPVCKGEKISDLAPIRDLKTLKDWRKK